MRPVEGRAEGAERLGGPQAPKDAGRAGAGGRAPSANHVQSEIGEQEWAWYATRDPALLLRSELLAEENPAGETSPA